MLTLIFLFSIPYSLKSEKHPLELFVSTSRVCTLLKVSGLYLFWILYSIWDVNVAAHWYLQHEVNSRLGFDYATPEEKRGEIFIITEIVPGKFMESTGLKVDDEIRYTAVDNLYHLILYNRGREVSIPILRGSDSLIVSFRVPHFHTRINPDRMWWSLEEEEYL